MKSRLGGYSGGSCSFSAGTLARRDGGHGKYPAFLLNEPRGAREPCPWPAGTCFPLESISLTTSRDGPKSPGLEKRSHGQLVQLREPCLYGRALRTSQLQEATVSQISTSAGFGASLGKPLGISPSRGAASLGAGLSMLGRPLEGSQIALGKQLEPGQDVTHTPTHAWTHA